ncbi:hypothetical protein TWF718_000694 [Orbilia javanica]|uniref:Uncharacterized protein n=1 Tax=Orbilia javanica TaxID=47235 RepID=A0AAN8MXH3_9PEZI
MCLVLNSRRRILLPLAVAILSQSVNLVYGQEAEQLFHLRIRSVELPGLPEAPLLLLKESRNGGDEVYAKENILLGDEIGMLDLGWTPSSTADPQITRTIIREENSTDQIQDPSEADGLYEQIQTHQSGVERRLATQLDYYTLNKFRDPRNKNDPSRFLLRFSNGHRFVWMPWVGLWSTWMAGTEEAMKALDDLGEPVFIQDANGFIRIEGADSWDNFVCRTPIVDESGAETQSESHGGPPTPVWWEFTSLQRTVWQADKVPRLSEYPIDCIPITLSLEEVGAPKANGVTAGADIIQQDVVEVEDETESDYTLGPQVEILSAGDYNPEAPFQFFIEESDPLISDAPVGGQSNFYSHGGTAQQLLEVDIEDESGSDDIDDYTYDPYYPGNVTPRPSEQIDNSQTDQEELQPLEIPESPAQRELSRANSLAALESGQGSWLQGFPRLANRYHSTGEISRGGANSGLLKALATKSEEILGKGPNGAPLKLMATKSDDVLRE